MIVITLLLFGVNIYGVLELKQEFILEDFVPADSPSKKYMDAKAKVAQFDIQLRFHVLNM